jgi:hypothetical protein
MAQEPTEEMILAGAKAGVDQIYYKQNAWERCVGNDFKQDYLNFAKFCWKAMKELEPSDVG